MYTPHAVEERIAALRARFGLGSSECSTNPLVTALEAAVWATQSRADRPSDYIGPAERALPPNATPVEIAYATAFALCFGAAKLDDTPILSREDCPPLAYTITPEGAVHLMARGASISYRGEVTIRPLMLGETVNGVEAHDGRHIVQFKAHLSQVPQLTWDTLKGLPSSQI